MSDKEYIWNTAEPQPIAIPLPDYQSRHSTHVHTHGLDRGFVGRDNLIAELLAILEQTHGQRGCYLIAGFRGSGKTSLINKVLDLHSGKSRRFDWLNCQQGEDKDNVINVSELLSIGRKKIFSWVRWDGSRSKQVKKYGIFHSCHMRGIKSRLKSIQRRFFRPLIHVDVNLGHDEKLNPRDVLFNTATLLYREFQQLSGYSTSERFFIHMLRWAPLLFASAIIIFWGWPWVPKPEDWPLQLWPLPNISISIDPKKIQPIGALIILLILQYLWGRYVPSYKKILNRLRWLHKRMAYTHEREAVVESKGLFLFRSRQTLPPLDARQIEIELRYILDECRKIHKLLIRPNVIFVFDELDKIAQRNREVEPNENNHAESSYEAIRKGKVDNLLSALKGFITQGGMPVFLYCR